MRTVSAPAGAGLTAQGTGEVFLTLLTIDHADLTAPIRLVNDRQDITSRSNVYTAAGFQHQLATDADGEVPRAEISISNVGQEIIEQIELLSEPPTIVVEIILASSPDTVEAGPWNYTLKSVDYDEFTITTSLGFENVVSEPFPAPRFTPLDFPGMFNSVDR